MNNKKFNKSFDALYNIAMNMADECIMNKPIEARFSKLDEEYRELIEEISLYLDEVKISEGDSRLETAKAVALHRLKGELSDVLFVLLHCSHKLGFTGFELLHQASSKMLARMNDSTYIAKN